MYHLDIVVICINRILHYLSQSYIGSLSLFTQHQDPYTIEPEQDLRKEQEEYFRRMRQEWIDLGTLYYE
jgi:hypothetical protein